jgi:pimeloyl-ACP methyl ester carboxylesterase
LAVPRRWQSRGCPFWLLPISPNLQALLRCKNNFEEKLSQSAWPGRDSERPLLRDYRTNVESYPKWQAWMRQKQPRLLVIWGKYESSFDSSEPESYRRDVPNAQIHIVDGGHFALDTAADDIATLIGQFMKPQK